ncbi:MAG: type II CRISPR-associated endonuclease Cas1 [Lachnospiraceae bacterium]|nr:type II CRISPR-associated endonuclease Cas1 [Lachnospiraceae bacterium]
MAFRTLEISNEAEIHIKDGQLEVTNKNGIALIPIEDLSIIMVHGANIRLSTMDISILSQNKVAILTLDEKYLPTAIILPYEGNARQSMLMHAQVNTSEEKYRKLWVNIIKQKISNQSRALSILGVEGAETIATYISKINIDNVDYIESLAAKDYFSYYHSGLNRRTEDPVNSRLNYGYAIVRSSIARSLVAVGFHPTFGIHHSSQLNAFNLADDLIEPFRAIVDVVAHKNISSNIILNKAERKELTHTLHNACIVNGVKTNVLSAIDMTSESLKRIILDKSNEELCLPTVLPVESMEGITE